jgi:hypothetical protein
MHPCRLIHAGPCMPVHSCQLLLMRACARRAYCKKMPGQFRVKKLWLAKCTCLNSDLHAPPTPLNCSFRVTPPPPPRRFRGIRLESGGGRVVL